MNLRRIISNQALRSATAARATFENAFIHFLLDYGKEKI